MRSKIVRCAAPSPLHALVFALLLALAMLGARGAPAFAAQEADRDGEGATASEFLGEDPGAPGTPRLLSSAIEWNLGDAESATVTITHPDGTVTRHEFGPGDVPRIEFDATSLAGPYVWEIVGAPSARLSETGNSGGFVGSGRLFVEAGIPRALPSGPLGPYGGGSSDGVLRLAERLENGVGSFRGGLCSGRNCTDSSEITRPGALFLRDTIHPPRIDFFSNTEPTWTLTGYSTGFAASGPRPVLWLTARAPENSLFVAATGRVGLRTSTPAKDLHINTPGSPTIRLERNASGGGKGRIWDIGAGATNFFIGDNSSRFPFQIQPDAPTGTLFLAASGNVGAGTDAPGAKLHVYGANGSTSETIEEASASSALRTLLNLRNRGGTRTLFDDTTIAQSWSVGTQNSGFVIDELANAGVEFQIDNNGNATIAGVIVAGQDVVAVRDLDVGRDARVAGNLTVLGQLIQPSSRSLKRDFAPVDAQAVLDLVVALPLSTWSYNSDVSVRHMGPVAEDFHAAFGLGGTDKGIATVDSDGVALAAIQGLQRRVEEENAELRRRIQVLEEMVTRLTQARQP